MTTRKRVTLEIEVEMESVEGGPEPTALDAELAVGHALQVAIREWDCDMTGAASELVELQSVRTTEIV